jgi:hypothetical protein
LPPIAICIIQNYSTINTYHVNTSAVHILHTLQNPFASSTGFLSIHDASLACSVTQQCSLHYGTLATKSAPPYAITDYNNNTNTIKVENILCREAWSGSTCFVWGVSWGIVLLIKGYRNSVTVQQLGADFLNMSKG